MKQFLKSRIYSVLSVSTAFAFVSGFIIGAATNQVIMTRRWQTQKVTNIEKIEEIEKRVEDIEELPPAIPEF